MHFIWGTVNLMLCNVMFLHQIRCHTVYTTTCKLKQKKSGCTHSFLSTEDYLHSFPDTFSPKQITSRQSNPSWHNAECSVNNTERKWPSNPRTTSVLIGGKHHSTNESDLSTIYTPVLLHNLDIKHLVNNVSNTSSRFHLWQSRLNTECVSHGQTADVVSARQFRGSSRRDVIRCSPTVCNSVCQSADD